jgi:hypothetical protein
MVMSPAMPDRSSRQVTWLPATSPATTTRFGCPGRAPGVRGAIEAGFRHVDLAGRPVRRKTWNLAGLFRLPAAAGPVWLKAIPASPLPDRPRSPRSLRAALIWCRPSWRARRAACC